MILPKPGAGSIWFGIWGHDEISSNDKSYDSRCGYRRCNEENARSAFGWARLVQVKAIAVSEREGIFQQAFAGVARLLYLNSSGFWSIAATRQDEQARVLQGKGNLFPKICGLRDLQQGDVCSGCG